MEIVRAECGEDLHRTPLHVGLRSKSYPKPLRLSDCLTPRVRRFLLAPTPPPDLRRPLYLITVSEAA
jgi:hypothetical protein